MAWGDSDKVADFGVDDLVADSVGEASPKAKAERDAKKRVKSTAAQVRMFTQGASLGFADELDAAGAAAETGLNNFVRKMTGRPSVGYGMKEAYDAVHDVENSADRKFQKDHPVQATTLQVAGGLATPGAARGARFIARGASAAGRMTRAAAVGGGLGAVAGAGTADGDLKARAKGAGVGLMTGAVTGGALQGGLETARVAGRVVNNATGHRFSSPENSAGARLREALQADGVDANGIEAAVREFERVGATAPTLADVAGENTRALLRTAGSFPGAARNTMENYRGETVHGLPDAAIERSRALTPGEQRPAHEVATALEEGREQAARTDYREPYAAPVQIDAQMAGALRGDTGRAAIQRARQAAAARRDDQQMAELDSLLASNMEEFPQVSAGTLDRIRIAMGERARTAGQRNANDMAGGLRSRAGDIDAGLDNVPGLQPARDAYRSSTRAIEAVNDIGPTLLRASPDEFGAHIAGLDQQGLQAAQVGARQALTDALGQRANAMGTVDQIAYAPNVRRNLTALFGEQEAGRYIDAARLNLQRARNANHMAPNSGSQTQLRGADAKRLMSAVNAVRSPVQAILERVANGLTITDAEARALVEAGLSDPRVAMQRLRPRMVNRATPSSRMITAASPAVSGSVNRSVDPGYAR